MIGLLNAYHLKDGEAYYQQYDVMFLNFLKSVLPDHPIKTYKVALGELPETTTECDGWIITGSIKGAYEADPWIAALGGFVQKLHADKRKLVGICFGHQLIAHYLGGRTEKSKDGWGVGVRQFEIIKTKEWMKPELKSCSLLFSHQDQVIVLPKEAELLATDSFCPHQMYSIENHIFCFQGHPEYTTEFARSRLDTRVHLVGQETYDRAVKTFEFKTDADVASNWIRTFLSN